MIDGHRSVLIVAGEASGDLHGSKVVARLRELEPGLEVFGVGGDRMREAGAEILFHTDEFAVVGFVEIVRHIPRHARAMRALVRQAAARGTRLAILIDYPGFNLMLARRLNEAGVRVLYYISPQVWAWGEGRVRKIERRVDRMAVVLPFEEEFYRRRGVDVEFVGHPLLEEPWIASIETPRSGLKDPPVLGLLPGSRRQEVARHASVMLRAARVLIDEVPDLNVRVGLARGVDPSLLSPDACGRRIEIVEGERVRDLIAAATALIVSSGTATLEAACAGTPMAIVYRMAPVSYAIARTLVRIPLIGLVNVVAGEEIVPEFVQDRATAGALASGVLPFLTDGGLAARTSEKLFAVRRALGSPGASERVARMAISMIEAAA